MDKYVFRKYSVSYKKYYSIERLRLKKILGLVFIEHIGSTAVSGIGGKGIVDIIVGIKSAKLVAYKKLLIQHGYEYRPRGGTAKRYFFQKDYFNSKNVRRVHIHLVKYKSIEWNSPIALRDFLKNNPGYVKEYALLKKKAVATSKGNGIIYRQYKERFLTNMTKKALKNN